nr:L-lactate permease [Bacillus subtilis]
MLLAANTAGGVMAKLVSPQSIAIAAAAVGTKQARNLNCLKGQWRTA